MGLGDDDHKIALLSYKFEQVAGSDNKFMINLKVLEVELQHLSFAVWRLVLQA